MWLKTELLKHFNYKVYKPYNRYTEFDKMVKTVIEKDCGEELRASRYWKWTPQYSRSEITFDYNNNKFKCIFNTDYWTHANCNVRKLYDSVSNTCDFNIDNLYKGIVYRNDKRLVIECEYNKDKILNGL